MDRLGDRRQRISKLMREHREKFVLTAVVFSQVSGCCLTVRNVLDGKQDELTSIAVGE